MAPKSEIESRAHYAPEPARGRYSEIIRPMKQDVLGHISGVNHQSNVPRPAT